MTNERAPRLDHEKRILLEFNAKLGFVGITKNISRSGALVGLSYPAKGVNVGQRGVFRVMSARGKFAYPFTVIRLDEMVIAINFINPPDDVVITMLREP
jgi:hypothetical protein